MDHKKSMASRFLNLFLSVTMVLGVMPVSVKAEGINPNNLYLSEADFIKEDNILKGLNDEGLFKLNEFSSLSGEKILNLNTESENLKLGDKIFENIPLSKVIITGSLKDIGDETFKNTGINDLYGERIENIGRESFAFNKIKTINLNNLKSIGYSAFLNNEIEEFTTGAETIYEGAFLNNSLKTLNLLSEKAVMDKNVFSPLPDGNKITVNSPDKSLFSQDENIYLVNPLSVSINFKDPDGIIIRNPENMIKESAKMPFDIALPEIEGYVKPFDVIKIENVNYDAVYGKKEEIIATEAETVSETVTETVTFETVAETVSEIQAETVTEIQTEIQTETVLIPDTSENITSEVITEETTIPETTVPEMTENVLTSEAITETQTESVDLNRNVSTVSEVNPQDMITARQAADVLNNGSISVLSTDAKNNKLNGSGFLLYRKDDGKTVGFNVPYKTGELNVYGDPMYSSRRPEGNFDIYTDDLSPLYGIDWYTESYGKAYYAQEMIKQYMPIKNEAGEFIKFSSMPVTDSMDYGLPGRYIHPIYENPKIWSDEYIIKNIYNHETFIKLDELKSISIDLESAPYVIDGYIPLMVRYSDYEGVAVFDNLPEGEYIIKEIEHPLFDTRYNFEPSTYIDVTGTAHAAISDSQPNAEVIFMHEPRNSIKIKKNTDTKELYNTVTTGDAVFALMQNGVKIQEARTGNMGGNARFLNVPAGHYTIVEVTPPALHTPLSEPVEVDFDAWSTLELTFENHYEPYNSNIMLKKVNMEGEIVPQAFFGIYIKDNGQTVCNDLSIDPGFESFLTYENQFWERSGHMYYRKSGCDIYSNDYHFETYTMDYRHSIWRTDFGVYSRRYMDKEFTVGKYSYSRETGEYTFIENVTLPAGVYGIDGTTIYYPNEGPLDLTDPEDYVTVSRLETLEPVMDSMWGNLYNDAYRGPVKNPDGSFYRIKYGDLQNIRSTPDNEPGWKLLRITQVNDKGEFNMKELPPGEFMIKEIMPPEGYALSDEKVYITLDENETKNIEFVNKKTPFIEGSIVVNKTDPKGNKLKDAYFGLYRKNDGKTIGFNEIYETGETYAGSGAIIYGSRRPEAQYDIYTDSLPVEYTTETKNIYTSEGLITRDVVKRRLFIENSIQRYHEISGIFSIIPRGLKITPGVYEDNYSVFSLSPSPDTYMGTDSESLMKYGDILLNSPDFSKEPYRIEGYDLLKLEKTDINGIVNFSNLYDGEYVVKELFPPEKYQLSEETQTALISKDSSQYNFTFSDEPLNDIFISKKSDGDAGYDMTKDAVFVLLKDGIPVSEVRTDWYGIAAFENLPAGKYTVIEKTPPALHKGSEIPVEIVFDAWNPVFIDFENEFHPNTSAVILNKLDIDRTPVPYAFFAIYIKDTGQTVCHDQLFNYMYDTWFLHYPGYPNSENLPITQVYRASGCDIYSMALEPDIYTRFDAPMYDDPATVYSKLAYIDKTFTVGRYKQTGWDSYEFIENIEMSPGVYNVDTSLGSDEDGVHEFAGPDDLIKIARITTDAFTHPWLPVTEFMGPEYADDDTYFMLKYSDLQNIRKSPDNEPGWKLLRIDQVNNQGVLNMKDLPAGDLMVKEIMAPEGYILSDEKIYITLGENETETVEFINNKIPEPIVPGEINIRKTFGDDFPESAHINGTEAVFELLYADGSKIPFEELDKMSVYDGGGQSSYKQHKYYVYDENNTVSDIYFGTSQNDELKIMNVPSGDYLLREVKSPVNFKKSDELIPVKADTVYRVYNVENTYIPHDGEILFTKTDGVNPMPGIQFGLFRKNDGLKVCAKPRGGSMRGLLPLNRFELFAAAGEFPLSDGETYSGDGCDITIEASDVDFDDFMPISYDQYKGKLEETVDPYGNFIYRRYTSWLTEPVTVYTSAYNAKNNIDPVILEKQPVSYNYDHEEGLFGIMDLYDEDGYPVTNPDESYRPDYIYYFAPMANIEDINEFLSVPVVTDNVFLTGDFKTPAPDNNSGWTFVGVAPTDENGEINLKSLPEGTYRIEELTVPEGYKKSQYVEAVITNDNPYHELSMVNEKETANFELYKINADFEGFIQAHINSNEDPGYPVSYFDEKPNPESIPGMMYVTFKIRRIDNAPFEMTLYKGELIEKTDNSYTVMTKELGLISGYLPDGDYVAEEIKPFPHFKPETGHEAGYEFTIAGNTPVVIEARNSLDTSVQAKIIKKDEKTGELLRGAYFAVYRHVPENERDRTYALSSVPTSAYNKNALYPDGSYVPLHASTFEETPYDVGNFTYTYNSDGIYLPYYDIHRGMAKMIPNYRNADGIKMDITTYNINPGFYMGRPDIDFIKKNIPVDSFITEPVTAYRSYDEYLLRINPTVIPAGNVGIVYDPKAVGAPYENVYMIYSGIGGTPYYVPYEEFDAVRKNDIYMGSPIYHYNESGISSEWVMVGLSETNDQGEVNMALLPEGEYKAVEILAPEGYMISDTPEKTFTVTDTRRTETIEFFNKKESGNITVIKTDSVTGESLPGAEFTLTDTDNNTLTGTTDDTGKFTFTDITPGSYKLQEIKAPTGYKLSEEIKEITIAGGEDIEIPFANIMDLRLLLKKTDTDGNVISLPSEFNLTWDKDNADTLVLSDGTVLHDIVLGQVYELTETKAPEGYRLNNRPLSLKADNENIKLSDDNTYYIYEVTFTDYKTTEELPGTGTFGVILWSFTAGALTLLSLIPTLKKRRIRR